MGNSAHSYCKSAYPPSVGAPGLNDPGPRRVRPIVGEWVVIAALACFGVAVFIPLALLGEEQRGIIAVEKSDPGDKAAAPSESLITGTYRALIVGNDAYRGRKWPPLKTAVRDAEELANVLRQKYGFAEEHVILRRNATRRDLVRGFLDLAEAAQPEDHVLIYYAGHGEYDELERGYWVPVDAEDRADYVSNDEILGWIRSIKAKHKFLISDSCFSGNMLTRGVRDVPSDRVLPSRYVIEKTKLVSVQGFTSGGNEPVSDGGAQWNGHSIFAYHLLAQLKANQQPYLSAQWLGFRAAELVANDTASALGQGQTPVFSPIANQGHQGGDFFFRALGGGSMPALVVIVVEGRPDFAQASAKARDVIANHLKQNMATMDVPFAPADAEPEAEWSSDRLLELLRGRETDRALVVRLRGELRPDQNSLWQGLSTLNMALEAYRLAEGKLAPIATHHLQPQTLPMREWSENQAVLETQFEKTAEKLVSRGRQDEMTQFFTHLRD